MSLVSWSASRKSGSSVNVYFEGGAISIGSPDNTPVPPHLVPGRFLKDAPQQVKDELAARAVGQPAGPWWGTVFFVPSGGSVTGAAQVCGTVAAAGGHVIWGIDATPSAAAAHPVFTAQHSADGVNWYTANGTTPSLSGQAIAGIQASAIEVTGPLNAYQRLLVSAGANTGVSSPVTVKYRVIFP